MSSELSVLNLSPTVGGEIMSALLPDGLLTVREAVYPWAVWYAVEINAERSQSAAEFADLGTALRWAAELLEVES